MATFLVHRSDRASSAATASAAFLERRPVDHNLVLSLLADRLDGSVPGRYWWVAERGEVQGVALQSPTSFRATMTPMPSAAIGPLVDAVAAEAPDLPGIQGEAATAAAFAGTWTERFGVAAQVIEGQRLYVVDEPRPPTGVPGALRVATGGDVELLAAWFVAFHDEVGESAPVDDPVAAARAMVDQGRLWVWEHDGEVVSSAMITRPAVGTARIGFVYTPADGRGHGRAAAAVSALVDRALAPGWPMGRVERCVLYTQLQNAVSNRVYRRIGFRAVSEVLVYGFVGATPPA